MMTICELFDTFTRYTLEVFDNYIVDNLNLSDAQYRPAHGLTFMLIVSGFGTIRTKERDYGLKKGTLVSIAPFQTYAFKEWSEDLKYWRMTFELDFMAGFPLVLETNVAEKMEREPCLLPDRKTFGLLKRYHKEISEQYERIGHPSRIEIVKALLYIYMAEVSRLYSQRTVALNTSHEEQVAGDFLKLLHTYYRSERKPEFYAGKLCVSPRYLSRLLKKSTGRTLFTWICEFVVKEAKIMLSSTDKSVSQISDELNFPNPSYFSRYFRKYTGTSPLKYKKHLK
ncbi:MAG: helix-turn-helix transcriptional regulator [Bacteroidales bacterium]|jgi:AraC-like DNA-binding protein|nr:helix-turn-helix transcriptional regulator [Bacteroidales bacterium]MCI2121723.1 helix-turn-helix transcriptional regulator [Bacteroidales bacterium]MCI2145365.1 helix-turn-helix transcriptional regulator [Bacteroidales bacterium]